MPKKTIDIVSGGVTATQDIVVENATGVDSGAFAPARALQVSGALASTSNPVPTANVAIGSTSDVAATADDSNVGLIALFKRLLGKFGLFQGSAGTPNANVVTVQGISGATSVPVSLETLPSGTNALGSVNVSNFPVTQPISAVNLPLPTGAATAAKQPSLGTAGFPSTDVVTVQGAGTMTPLKVDGSGVTQPVSLTTLPSGTNALGSVSISNFPATQPVSLTTLPSGTNALGSVSVSNFPATQPVSLTTLPSGTNALGSVSVSNFPATQPVSLVSSADATPIAEAALTAVGTTSARSVAGYRYYSYQATVTGIGTNVILRIEGTHVASPTADDWYSLQSNNVDTTITANGSYKFQIAGETDLQVRMNLVSFSGGSPSVACILIKGN